MSYFCVIIAFAQGVVAGALAAHLLLHGAHRRRLLLSARGRHLVLPERDQCAPHAAGYPPASPADA